MGGMTAFPGGDVPDGAEPCDAWRGAIALAAIGRLPEGERVALDAHTDGCPACRAELAELRTVGDQLALADPAHLATAPGPPPGLADRVLGALDGERRADEERRVADLSAERARLRARGRARLISFGGAIAVAAAAVAAVVVLTTGPAPVRTTYALRGSGTSATASATVSVTGEPWGMAVTVDSHGVPAGRTLEVSMRTWTGGWWEAGTFRSVAGGTSVQMACALSPSDVVGVRVTDAGGHVVMESYGTS